MAKMTTAEFIEAIKELSVLELNELVKACEEEFGVSLSLIHILKDTSMRAQLDHITGKVLMQFGMTYEKFHGWQGPVQG